MAATPDPPSVPIRRRTPRILLVEDDVAAQELTRRALDEVGAGGAELAVANDGEEALDYLFRRGRYVGVRLPDLVLLDLNLPRSSGKEVLATVKADPALRELPVVVLTTSARQRDIQESYALGCNSYLVKPLDARQFFRSFESLYRYWFGTVSLPTG